MNSTPAQDVPIRHASTVIVLRHTDDGACVLMGQRGKSAAFMPNKFVFPGGAVDDDDAQADIVPPPDPCLTRLGKVPRGVAATALLAAAVRELWEETGLRLARSGSSAPLWDGFANGGYRPDASALRYFFRAITPPGRPRRFDARFFLVDAAALTGDLDDFSAASDELSHLQWVPLNQARSFDLPFITEVVLAELSHHADPTEPPAFVPFFQNDDEGQLYRTLGR